MEFEGEEFGPCPICDAVVSGATAGLRARHRRACQEEWLGDAEADLEAQAEDWEREEAEEDD